MMNSAIFNSYADCDAFFRKARSPAKGRPIASIGRMFKIVDVYLPSPKISTTAQYFSICEANGGTEMCRVYPDDTVEFTVAAKEVVNCYTLVATFSRILPIIVSRYKTGKYRIGGTQEFTRIRQADIDAPPRYWSNAGWKWLRSEAPQYFKGIRFRLSDGACINPMPDTKRVIDSDARKVWLRDLRCYKKHLKVIAKMGGFQGYRGANSSYAEQIEAKVVMSGLKWKQMLAKNMRENTFPAEVLGPIARSAQSNWSQSNWYPPNNVAFIKHVDTVFTRLSEDLRGEYRVFTGSLHVKE
jgi:hypothetical protein